jgi:hypothetical protein
MINKKAKINLLEENIAKQQSYANLSANPQIKNGYLDNIEILKAILEDVKKLEDGK